MNLPDFEKKWFDRVEEYLLRSFPQDFLEGHETESFDLPGKSLLKGPELFGQYELLDTEGNSIISTNNLELIKYILYSNRNLPRKIKIPSDPDQISSMVEVYENHLDEIIKKIKEDFKSEYPNSSKTEITINKIFQRLNLYRY